MSDYIQQNAYPINYTSSAWTILSPIEQSIKDKIEKYGTPLKDWNVTINYGIKTGCNEAFIIDDITRRELIAKDPKSAELIRPILRGRDIKRYGYDFAGLYLINIECGYTNRNKGTVDAETWFKETYPAIYEHFQKIASKTTRGKGLVNRDDKGEYWWELRSCAYTNDFSQQKIVYREISDTMNATFVNENIFINNKCYLVTGEIDLGYLLAYLNSKVFNAIILRSTNQTGGKGAEFLQKIKMPPMPEETITQVSEIARKLCTQDNQKLLEKIDSIICAAFNLTEAEIQYIGQFH